MLFRNPFEELLQEITHYFIMEIQKEFLEFASWNPEFCREYLSDISFNFGEDSVGCSSTINENKNRFTFIINDGTEILFHLDIISKHSPVVK